MSVQVSYKKQTTLGIIGLLILFLVVELLANVWWMSQINCEFEENEIFKQMDDAKKRQLCVDLYEIKTSGNELIPNQQSQTININSMGFRGEEFSIEKPENVYRIFMLGGSTMFGHGATSDQTTIPGYLQELFQNYSEGFDIEIINSGIQGADSFSELNLISKKLLNYSPDMIVVYDGWNDLRAEHSVEQIENNWNSVCNLGNENGFDTIVVLQPIAGFGNKILTEQELDYSKNGVNYNNQPLINSFTNYEKYTNSIQTLSECSMSFNLRTVFDNETSAIYWDQGHVSDYGNNLVSKAIYAQIKEILPTKNLPATNNFQNKIMPEDSTIETEFRNLFSIYKTPLMINSIFSLEHLKIPVNEIEQSSSNKINQKLFETQRKIYDEDEISVIIEILDGVDDSQKKLKIKTINHNDDDSIQNVTYFLKILKDDTIIFSDFFFVENDIFVLDISSNNSDSIKISGERQYDHNAIIATTSPPLKLSGPILLSDTDYEFIFELRTLYDKSNWIFSLDGFQVKITQ